LHILQIKRAVDVGEDVFGDPERFLRWLRHSCEALAGKVPFKLLGSITGARLVRDELVRIDYGLCLGQTHKTVSRIIEQPDHSCHLRERCRTLNSE